MRSGRAGARLVASALALAVACGPSDGSDGSGEATPGSEDDGPFSLAQEGRIATPSGPLAWVRVGEGPALVVVHGGPGLDHRYLRPGLDALARGRSVVYWDQRGVGRSVPGAGALDTLALGWESNLRDLDRVAGRFGDESGRVALLAHSWGALPALAWALTRPGRVRALVLVAPAEPGSRFAEPTRRRREARSDPLAQARLDSLLALPVGRRTEPGPRSEMMRAAFRVAAPDPDVVDRLDLDLLPATASNGDVVARRVMGTAGDLDLWDEMVHLDVPVLIVQGTEDLVPPELARALEDALPRGQAALVEGAGHFPFVPGGAGFDSFVAAVDSFLVRSEGR